LHTLVLPQDLEKDNNPVVLYRKRSLVEPLEANGYNVEIVLADVVRVSEGKLDALGIGWRFMSPDASIGLGIIVDVPWAEANRPQHLSLKLEDADGHTVLIPSQEGGFTPFTYEVDFEVGRPPGIPVGTALPYVAPAVTMPPGSLGLSPGKRYTFTVFVNNRTEPGWQRTFAVQAGPPLKMAS
jgi:hypothetical protein